MKSNSKFFLGLSCGLVISFFIFNSNAILNASNSIPETKVAALNTGNPEMDGSWVQMQSMSEKISSYKTNVANKLGANANTGGFIKRSVLNDITGAGDGAYIKYSFFYEGNGKIGIIFQKKANEESGIMTGSASYCPTMCQYPE